MSGPVQVKTQQGVPSQPSNFRTVDIGENSVTLQWSKPTHSSENIVHYELYYVSIELIFRFDKQKHKLTISILSLLTERHICK